MLYLHKGIIRTRYTQSIVVHSVPYVLFMYIIMFFYYSLNKDSKSGFWELINNSQKITSYFVVLDVLFLSSYSIGIITESVKNSHQLFLHRQHPCHKKSSHAQKRFRFIIISFKSLINPFSLNDFQSNFYKYGKWYAIVGLIWSHQPQILPMAPAYGHDMAHQSS